MRSKKPLSLKNFNIPVVKEGLIALSLLTVEDIQKLWTESDDNRGEPVFVKMTNRFNNCNRRIAQFYHQLDPHNKRLLVSSRVCDWKIDLSMNEFGEMIEFFAWMSNMLSFVDILKMERIEYRRGVDYQDPKNSSWVGLWSRNPIILFYSILSAENCKQLVARYNKTEIGIEEVDNVEMIPKPAKKLVATNLSEFDRYHGGSSYVSEMASRYPGVFARPDLMQSSSCQEEIPTSASSSTSTGRANIEATRRWLDELDRYKKQTAEVVILAAQHPGLFNFNDLMSAPDLETHHNPSYVPPSSHQEERLKRMRQRIEESKQTDLSPNVK